MKSYTRRYRRSNARTIESAQLKKDAQQEQPFFAGPSSGSFFKPAVLQLKCDHCAADENKLQRAEAPKEEDNKIQRAADQKEEDNKVQRVADQMEEDKSVRRSAGTGEPGSLQRMEAPKEEEKKLQRMEAPKEEKKLERKEVPKEEEKLQRSGDNYLQRANETKEAEQKTSRKEVSGAPMTDGNTAAYVHSLGGKGSTLPAHAVHFFGERMGFDFSNVKIHTGTEAEQSAKSINAKAYATGNNIVFNKGQYNPSSAEGQKLLAHELTHVVQQQGGTPGLLSRVAQLNDKKHEEEKAIIIAGQGTKKHNKTAHGCGGVQVHGQTDANYSSSFETTGKLKPTDACTACTPPDCITTKGYVVSNFKSAPVITLPAVPDGLSKCETIAVRKFINGTLKRHEQKHRNAFKTYDGKIKTPYQFTGCRSDLDTLVQSIHDGVDAQRAADANALSDALDPFNVTIPCNCD